MCRHGADGGGDALGLDQRCRRVGIEVAAVDGDVDLAHRRILQPRAASGSCAFEGWDHRVEEDGGRNDHRVLRIDEGLEVAAAATGEQRTGLADVGDAADDDVEARRVGQCDRDFVADFGVHRSGRFGAEHRAVRADATLDQFDGWVVCGVVGIEAEELGRAGRRTTVG